MDATQTTGDLVDEEGRSPMIVLSDIQAAEFTAVVAGVTTAGGSKQVSRPDLDTSSTWKAVHEAMTTFDEKLINDWRDELQNLLTFAGLFSAVVTAFVAISYTWLQENSQDASTYLLRTISQQLNGFVINPRFINTTAPAPSSQPNFVPLPIYVKINTLWMITLSMSLVAALFAILVQPWLREYKAPGYLSIREAVRMREYRRRALYNWGVPAIISLIPILLQSALIIFLFGLGLLLRSLNKAVFIPWAIFGTGSLLLFAVTIVAPLPFDGCSYKSPASYALLFVLKTCVVTICSVISAAILVPTFVFLKVVSYLTFLFPGLRHIRSRVDSRIADTEHRVWATWSRLLQPLRKTPIHFHSSGSEYWIARERAALFQEAQILQSGKSSQKSKGERGNTMDKPDQSALSWVLDWLPEERWPQLLRCVDLLPSHRRLRVAVQWVAQSLNVESKGLRPVLGTSIDRALLAKIDKEFSQRYRALLQSVFPETWMDHSPRGRMDLKDGPSVVIVMHSIAKVEGPENAEFVKWYTSRLIHLRRSQTTLVPLIQLRLATTESALLRLPTVFLFDYCNNVKEALAHTLSDIETLFQWAEERCDPAHLLNPYWQNELEFLLCSTALVFMVYAQHHSTLANSTNIRGTFGRLCQALHGIIRDQADRVRTLAKMSAAGRLSPDGIPYLTAPAVASLCQSIKTMAARQEVVQSDAYRESLPALQRVVHELAELVRDQKGLEVAARTLDELDCLDGAAALSSGEKSSDYRDPIMSRPSYHPQYSSIKTDRTSMFQDSQVQSLPTLARLNG